jgi:hypothetical protein
MFNDSVAKGAEGFHDEELVFKFLCECGDLNCKGIVELTLAQYRVARSWPVVAHSTVAA